MRKLLFGSLLLFATFSYGQVTIREIKEVNPQHKDEKYLFPFVVIPNNKNVADKINDFLVSDILDVDRRKIKKSIFENVWSTTGNRMQRLSDLSYGVIENNKKLFSISISAEGCGAYCENFTNYYSFDLKTGNRIKLDSLLSKTGVLMLLDSINAKRRQMLTTKIKETQDTLKVQSVQSSKEDKEYYEEMLSLYQECLEREVTSFEYLRFYITSSDLFVSLDRCSAHYNRNVDEIGEFEFVYKLKNWTRYLTSFANRVTHE